MSIIATTALVLAANLNIVADNPEQAFVAPMADVPVVVEAPRAAWGIRPVIRDIKRNVKLDIVYRRGVTCAQYPTRRCLEVHIGSYFFEGHGQYSYFTGVQGERFDIHLNARYAAIFDGAFKQETAAHEFGHFLGFSHHAQHEGIMGTYWNIYDRPSLAEYRVLWSHYGTP